MKKLDIRGELNVLLISLILIIIVLFGTGGFAYWAYSNMTKYKTQTDAIAAADVKASNAALTKTLQAQFAEQEKNPYKTYVGPATYASLHVVYPKTWSAYIAVNGSGADAALDGYFYPDVIPNTDSGSGGANLTNFALRVQVLNEDYSQLLTQYLSLTQSGQVQVQPYHLPKEPTVIGSWVTGQIQDNKTGTLIMLPVRNYTLEIWTEGSQFLPDFNNIVVPNFDFSP